MGGLAKLLLEIVIKNRVLPVFMVVNNCKNVVDYVSALKIDIGVWGGWRNISPAPLPFCLSITLFIRL